VLWRHGQTLWNLEQRFQGQSDIPLDNTGHAQAERAARLLAALRPTMIVSSDLTRAAATATPLARLTGLEVTLDKDLRERHGGSWEGLTDEEIRERYPAEHASWMPPDGEPSAAVADRVAGALQRAAAAVEPDGLAVVVSHGAALRLGMSRLLGMPEELFGVLGPLSNCSWSVLGFRGGTALLSSGGAPPPRTPLANPPGGTRHGRWRLLEHNAGTLPEPIFGDDR
jgi:glucosyl-3-phosphoglycerate phosphatase